MSKVSICCDGKAVLFLQCHLTTAALCLECKHYKRGDVHLMPSAQTIWNTPEAKRKENLIARTECATYIHPYMRRCSCSFIWSRLSNQSNAT